MVRYNTKENMMRLANYYLGAANKGGKNLAKMGYSRRPKFAARKFSTRRGAVPRKVKGLTKQVKELKRIAESDMGTHTQRNRVTHPVLSIINQQNYLSVASSTKTILEAVLAELRYYDPAIPGTLLQADGAVGSFQKEFYFSKNHSKITVRNNYQVPCMVSVYSMRPKSDTSIIPSTAFTQGLADVGNPDVLSPLLHLTDSIELTDLWRIEKSKRVKLEPGQQCVMTTTGKPFQYDPAFADAHTSAYQPRFNGHSWHVAVQGVVGHDTIADSQGVLAAGVDLVIDTMFMIKYAAGADINFLILNDESGGFSNTGVVSNKPYTDNQGYSVQ